MNGEDNITPKTWEHCIKRSIKYLLTQQLYEINNSFLYTHIKNFFSCIDSQAHGPYSLKTVGDCYKSALLEAIKGLDIDLINILFDRNQKMASDRLEETHACALTQAL